MSVEASSLQNQNTHINNNHEYKTKQNEESDEEDEYHLENSEQLSVLIEPELSPQIVRIDKVKAKKLELRESLKKQALKNPVLSTLDVLISIFVVTSLVVGCWRGTWVLMDRHSRFFPMWESFLTGISAHALLAFGQSVFHDIIIETKKNNNFFRIACFILKKFYTYAFMVATVLHWRGGWAILDYYTGIQMKDNKVSNAGTSLVVAGVCLALLLLMKCVINATAPPFAICMDKGEDMFLFPTMFRQKIGEKTSLYILDCLFSVLVVGTLVVFVWRGAWIILDLYLFPNDLNYSSLSSLILGYTLVAIAFLIQPLMRYFCNVLSGAPRLLVADFFILFSFFGTVNVWRGIWNLLDLYLLPNNLELSCWITHWVSLIVLILLGCSNSLLVRGVYIDAEEPAGKCVVFPCHYLRIIFQEEKLKKIHNKQDQNVEKGTPLEKTAESNHVTVSVVDLDNHKG